MTPEQEIAQLRNEVAVLRRLLTSRVKTINRYSLDKKLLDRCAIAAEAATTRGEFRISYSSPAEGWFTTHGVSISGGYNQVSMKDLKNLVKQGYLVEATYEEALKRNTYATLFRLNDKPLEVVE